MRHFEPSSNQLFISVGKLHSGQMAAYHHLRGHRFMALRCGRRFGKTALAEAWVKEGLLQGQACAWFAPQHMLSSEAYADLSRDLAPLIDQSSRGNGIIRLVTDGRLDFGPWKTPARDGAADTTAS